MTDVTKCPICGGELIEKKVDKLLRGGNNTAIVQVNALVCQECGEKLYLPETIELFDQIQEKLEAQDLADYTLIGNFYQVA
ncbi:MAG: YgiT-type zinc finger protein [Ardenticatenaceae bacterium]|nr:YgiT-type zinc finger protein [Ardenticatenaceae bacterium]